MISTIKGLKNALTNRSASKVESVLVDCMTFAAQQLKEHSNATPLSIIYQQLGNVAGKPKGCQTSNFVQVIEDSGLVLDKKEKIVSFPKKNKGSVKEIRVDWWKAYEDASKVTTLKFSPIKADKIQEKAELTLKRAKLSDQAALLTQRNLLKAQLAAIESQIVTVADETTAQA